MVTKAKAKSTASARQKQTVIVHVGDTSKKRKPRRKPRKPKAQVESFGQVLRIPHTVIMEAPGPIAPKPIAPPLQQPTPMETKREDHKPLHEQMASQSFQTPRKPEGKPPIPVPFTEPETPFAKAAAHKETPAPSFAEAATQPAQTPESLGKKISRVEQLKAREAAGETLSGKDNTYLRSQEKKKLAGKRLKSLDEMVARGDLVVSDKKVRTTSPSPQEVSSGGGGLTEKVHTL